jgi:hypothetical protein
MTVIEFPSSPLLRHRARRVDPLSFVEQELALLVAFLGAACSYDYDEERLWENCCALEIADHKGASSRERHTLMAWDGAVGFHGDGTSQDWERTKAWRKQTIALGLADFQEAHPASQPRDYLAGLGMTCGPCRSAKAESTRCAPRLGGMYREVRMALFP